ncbi:hypothetical protein DSO57_1019494 [Entomophthora muscae]|uniref:Uncharacterized protein n=1 Tax=Entomophthora muscae TaxID=34485 RepID=A0ACC2U231_9FUNG|nr:hypothetical protein DSO57_1019494 [Entomophthora muscae]
MDPVKRIVEVELLKEEITTQKQALSSFNSKLQVNQQALDYLDCNDDIPKLWMNFGTMFIKFPNQKIQTLLKADSADSQKNMKRLEKEIAEKTRELRKKEGKSIAQV